MAEAGLQLKDEEIYDLLKEEYIAIQKYVQSFDDKALTIKAWSVSFSLATIVGAFATHSAFVVAVAGLSALSFWITEVYIRAYQFAYYDRNGRIEKYFKKKTPSFTPFQTGTSWSESFAKIGPRKLATISIWPEVMFPHILPVALSIGLILMESLNLIRI